MTNSTWFPDTVHPNSRGMAAMAAVMFENLFATPNSGAPEVTVQKMSATRNILSWPANWGSVVVQYTTALRGTNTTWLVNETVPYGDGETIRQTNTISGPLRVYQLKRP